VTTSLALAVILAAVPVALVVAALVRRRNARPVTPTELRVYAAVALAAAVGHAILGFIPAVIVAATAASVFFALALVVDDNRPGPGLPTALDQLAARVANEHPTSVLVPEPGGDSVPAVFAPHLYRAMPDYAAQAAGHSTGLVIFLDDATTALNDAQTDAYAAGRADEAEQPSTAALQAMRLGTAAWQDNDDPEQADAAAEPDCTGVTATWCPVHGDCRCPRYEHNGYIPAMDDPDCPLHAPESLHGPDMPGLIDRSTLGTPEAAALRASTPPEVRAEIVAGVTEPPPIDVGAEIARIVGLTPGQLDTIRQATAAGDRARALRIINDALGRSGPGVAHTAADETMAIWRAEHQHEDPPSRPVGEGPDA
jgi:hypothetical protein